MKGQSDYDSVNFHMGLFFDMSGFASGDYNTIVMPDDVSEGDPFLTIAAETKPTWNPGSAVVELGLWDDYRIKVDSAGIWGWNEAGTKWVDLLTSGGDLNDLTDVVIDGTPANNEVLAYDSGGNWINQTPFEAGLATAGHGHAQLHDQNHNNTYHTTNYEAENANIQGHVASPATSAHHVKYSNANALSAVGMSSVRTFNGAVAMSANEINDCTYYKVDSGDGFGLRFWNGSSSYSIYMSTAANATYGGELVTTSDYNMYFVMSGGDNRGFVFCNGLQGEYFHITPTDVYSSAHIRVRDGHSFIAYSTGNDKYIQIYHNDVDGIIHVPTGDGHLVINADDTTKSIYLKIGSAQKATLSNTALTMNVDINMNAKAILGVQELKINTQTKFWEYLATSIVIQNYSNQYTQTVHALAFQDHPASYHPEMAIPDYDVLDTLMQIKNTPEGLIDLASFPEDCKGENVGGSIGLKIGKRINYTIKGIQELNDKITDLETTIIELVARIVELEKL